MRIKLKPSFLLSLFFLLIPIMVCHSQLIIEYIKNNNLRAIDSLLRADPTCIHQTDQGGATALHYAAWNNDTISADLLLKNGADINQKDNSNSTPLVWAIYNREYEIVKFLVDHNASITWSDQGGNKLLHLAATLGMPEIMELLIKNGLNVNAGNKYSVTPLHIAASINSPVMTRNLLDHGADPTLFCSTGKNAFHYAIDYESDSVIMILESIMKDPGKEKFPSLHGQYLGMKIPDTIPEIFAPGLLITPFFIHGQIAFSDDLEEMAWSDNAQPVSRIWHMRIEDGKWTTPVPLPFSKDYYSCAPFFALDGKRLYFYSARPEISGNDTLQTIWYVERDHNQWTQPVKVPIPGWEGKFAGFPTFSNSGNLYFYSYDQEDGLGLCDLYVSELTNGRFAKPGNLGISMNSPYQDIEPAVAPDEEYVVFSSTRQENVQSAIELYVSFKKPDGGWTPAKNLGRTVNRGRSWRPYITPDGRFLFYNSDHSGIYEYYWISTEIIKNLKQKPDSEL